MPLSVLTDTDPGVDDAIVPPLDLFAPRHVVQTRLECQGEVTLTAVGPLPNLALVKASLQSPSGGA